MEYDNLSNFSIGVLRFLHIRVRPDAYLKPHMSEAS